MSNKLYDFLKRLVQIVLPAAASLYFGLASIWEFPNPDKVVGTIAVITTFLGVILGISNNLYYSSGAMYDGELVVSRKQDGGEVFTLELDGDPHDIPKFNNLLFKVKVDENAQYEPDEALDP